MRSIFKIDLNDQLQEACRYILDYPPEKQVIIKGSIKYEPQVRYHGTSDVDFLLQMVECVRNNLFHGGKHNNDNTVRTELLLNSVLLILDECLSVQIVKEKYDQAII